MNKLLGGAIVVILLVIAVEGGYYVGMKTNRQCPQIPSAVVNQPTQPPSNSNAQTVVAQKTVELTEILKEGTKKIASGELKAAALDLIKAGTLRSEIDRLNFKSSFGNYYTALLPVPELTDFPSDKKFTTEFAAELKQLNFGSVVDIHNNDLAKIFYRLGLIAFRNNHQKLVPPLWTAMVNLSPEWSHFQLELANYYLAAGNIQAAKNSIGYCGNFNFPDEICLDFQNNEIQNNQPHPVGFMEDKIQTEVVNN